MRFSVIVPTRNRPAFLDRCLTAIGALDYPPHEFEVLVIDDASDTEPTAVIAPHTARMNLRYYHFDTPRGPARARNCGLREAQGEYLALTDDDCAPLPGWLSAFDRSIADHPAAAFGGKIVDAVENNLCGRASQLLVTFLYQSLQPGSIVPPFFCSNNLVFPRKALLDLGGFDEKFPLAAAEDRELCARWSQSRELRFVPDAVVRHRQVAGLGSFLNQHFRYGLGAAHFWSTRRASGQPGRRMQPPRFYIAMLGYPFSVEPIPRAAALSLLIAISQIANAAGYFTARAGSRTRAPR